MSYKQSQDSSDILSLISSEFVFSKRAMRIPDFSNCKIEKVREFFIIIQKKETTHTKMFMFLVNSKLKFAFEKKII